MIRLTMLYIVAPVGFGLVAWRLGLKMLEVIAR